MKKVISIALVVAMLMSLMGGTVSAAGPDALVISADNLRMLTGNWATVTLVVEQNPGFQGMSFYPVIRNSNGEIVNWTWEVDMTNSEFGFDVNEGSMVLLTADEDITNTGVLLEVRFFIDEAEAVGQYTISFDLYRNECFDMSGNIVAVELPSVTVNVMDYVYGDTDGDLSIDLYDALLLRQFLANRNLMTGVSSVEVAPGADANGDGKVGLQDALLLRRYLANRDPETGESTVVLGPAVDESYQWVDDGKNYTYHTFDTVLPSNWNKLSYQTANASDLIGYLDSPFFTFDYKLDEKGEIIPGEFVVNYAAAVGLEDVTAEYAEDWNLPGDRGYAYKITLRDGLMWENGDPIVAGDFVYTMQEQLNPLFQHYRAADWYGTATLSIAGAEDYNNQGVSRYIDDASCHISSLTKDENGNYFTADGFAVYIAVDYPISWCGGNTLKQYVDAYGTAYFGLDRWEELVALMDENGLVPANDETLAMLSATTTTNPNWGETDANLPNYLVYHKAYPETSWDEVGLLALDDKTLVIIMNKSLELLDEEGNLTYHCAYTFSGLPLVHQATFEACKQAPGQGETLWTSNYNTSKETTMSWGAYKLESFQMDKEYVLVRNTNWYGYDLEENEGLYMTDKIVEEVIHEWDTAWLMFLAGEIDSIGLSNAGLLDYRSSARTYFTPGTTTFFLILNGHMESIKTREAAEDFDQSIRDLEMLTNTKFHMAMGLSYDKDDFAATISPARSGALGIIGTGYIYDPNSGARYRDTDQAKQVLCDFYGVDTSKYADLDAAVDSITGYDPEQAKVLFTEAFAEGIAAGYITDNDGDGKSDQTVYIEYAMSAGVSDFMTKTINYLNEKLAEVTTGTPFEGKIEFYMSAPYGDQWSNMIREGLSDTVLGGWSGSTLNPFSLTDLYTNPSRQYDAAWYDATKIELTINVPVNGTNKDVTLTLKQWSDALNGSAVEVDGVNYNFGDGWADVETRLNILAAIEGKILESYNYLPMLQDGAQSMLSYKLDYITDEYNLFVGFGGLKHASYNYTDEEWEAFRAAHNYDLSEVYKRAKDSETDEENHDLGWSVIGGICGTNWATDFPMTKIDDITWESAPLELKAGEEFKVRQGCAWDVNFGVEFSGANIVVETGGTYIVRLVWHGGADGTVTLIPVN